MLQGIQDPRDDKRAPLEALWVPPRRILQPERTFKELDSPALQAFAQVQADNFPLKQSCDLK